MRAQRLPRGSRKGFVLIYYSLCLMVLLPIVGLAVDVGMLYSIRSKLTAAIDASALAAGRSLSRGISFTNAKPIATDTANRFFAANFPNGYWGAKLTAGSPTVNVTNPEGRMQVDITASVDVPLLFLRVLQYPSSMVASSGQAIRRNVNLVLVLDRSGSIASATDGPKSVRDSSISFVNRMVENQDVVGLISFDGNIHSHFSPKTVFKSQATTEINSIVFTGWTNSAGALSTAYEMIVALSEPGSHNVIVFFTDGRPTALSGDFPKKDKIDDRYRFINEQNAPRNPPPQNTLRTYAASNCTNNTIRGYMAAGAYWDPSQTGDTSGVFKDKWESASDNGDPVSTPNAAGCFGTTTPYHVAYNAWSVNQYTRNTDYVRGAIAFIPSLDPWGNITDSSSGYLSPPTFPAGHPYAGKIRPDSPKALRYAAYNAVDSCAKRIRADTTLKPIVYTIGLGGTNGQESIDDVLLERLANDPRSPIYDDNVPQGKYAKANDPTELQAAFDEIASQVLRLSQ